MVGLNDFSTYKGKKSTGIQWKLYFEFSILIFFRASNRQHDALVMLGHSSEPQLPVSHPITRVNDRNTCNPSVPLTATLFFTFIVVFNKLYVIFNTYYKIGFVLGDFIQL